MVPSFVLVVVADGEHLTCGGFSLGKTIHLGSFKFITDYFDGLSLSPRRGDSGATFMGSTRNGTSSPWLAMTENSAEEFLTASSGEGGAPASPLHEAWHGGSARSCHNHTMDGEHSDHSGHNDGSTVEGGAVARYRPPLRATTCLLGGAASASPCSTTHHQARGSAIVKQAHQQASCYRGPAAHVTMT
jgi:hypothetical protein